MATKQTKQKQPAALETIDVRPVLDADPDELFVQQAGTAIQSLLKGVVGFFTTAKALERTALLQLETAKRLTLPTSGAEDEGLQGFVRSVRADKRDVEEHWKITATVSSFHKRLTARRAKSTDALDEASRIANDLHNRYVEQERRRAAEAQEKLRREQEAEARFQREQELARLEAEAVAREESSPELSERELFFVQALLQNGGNAQAAAQRAGYADPLKTAARLTSSAKIQKAIKAKREALALREEAAARKEEPVHYDVPTITPDVVTKGNRTTWSAELLDEQALIAAIVAGKHGIPTDILTVKPAVLNSYARQLETRINLWPGVRAKKTTAVI